MKFFLFLIMIIILGASGWYITKKRMQDIKEFKKWAIKFTDKFVVTNKISYLSFAIGDSILAVNCWSLTFLQNNVFETITLILAILSYLVSIIGLGVSAFLFFKETQLAD